MISVSKSYLITMNALLVMTVDLGIIIHVLEFLKMNLSNFAKINHYSGYVLFVRMVLTVVNVT